MMKHAPEWVPTSDPVTQHATVGLRRPTMRVMEAREDTILETGVRLVGGLDGGW